MIRFYLFLHDTSGTLTQFYLFLSDTGGICRELSFIADNIFIDDVPPPLVLDTINHIIITNNIRPKVIYIIFKFVFCGLL